GLGTLEELLETLTWAQLGIHFKPCGLVNTAGYFDSLLELLDHGVSEGFIKPEYRRLLIAADEPAALLEAFERHDPPSVPRWLESDET
ncbi:MAG: LOG family protein, partial [Actinomycetota bacterium]